MPVPNHFCGDHLESLLERCKQISMIGQDRSIAIDKLISDMIGEQAD
jgi:hypothetical protein